MYYSYISVLIIAIGTETRLDIHNCFQYLITLGNFLTEIVFYIYYLYSPLFRKALNAALVQDIKNNVYKIEDAVLCVDMVEKSSIYGFQGNKKVHTLLSQA